MADLIDRGELRKDFCNMCEAMQPEMIDCEKKGCMSMQIIDEQPAVNRWIPCAERLPEDDCYTLVAVLFDEIYEVYIAAFRGDGWHTVEGYVTHWMPMPEPPEGGAGNAV